MVLRRKLHAYKDSWAVAGRPIPPTKTPDAPIPPDNASQACLANALPTPTPAPFPIPPPRSPTTLPRTRTRRWSHYTAEGRRLTTPYNPMLTMFSCSCIVLRVSLASGGFRTTRAFPTTDQNPLWLFLIGINCYLPAISNVIPDHGLTTSCCCPIWWHTPCIHFSRNCPFLTYLRVLIPNSSLHTSTTPSTTHGNPLPLIGSTHHGTYSL